MREILVLAEHRKGVLRDITWEMLSLGKELAEKMEAQLTTVLPGYEVKSLADELSTQADLVLLVEDERLQNFSSMAYQQVLSTLITTRKPIITLIGHTACGIDLAPGLAAALGMPLATDCLSLTLTEKELTAVRQIYGGKVNAEVACSCEKGCIATIRAGVVSPWGEETRKGKVEVIQSPSLEGISRQRFIEYVEAAIGGVDITQADIIVAIGRGIQDKENIPLAEELAKALGGTLACSRPIVDKKWLPKAHQVGTSGKTVRPKAYIALGISGAFQHIVGMKDSGVIIAVNKDPRAPIFEVADYGIVCDLFDFMPVLKEKAKELLQRR